MSRADDPLFRDWVARARAVACVDEIGRRTHALKRQGRYLIGPCPACGGDDRFSINLRKDIFWCRKSGVGGDAIAMVRYLDGADFLGACEILNNEPPPSGETGRKADPELQARRREQLAAEQAARAHEEIDYRAKEIAKARKIWGRAGPIAGSIAELYLRHRGVGPAPGAKLRAHERLAYYYYFKADKKWRQIFEGPAMVAAIQRPDGHFAGVHITYIDPGLLKGPLPETASGKVEIFAPDTGEELPAKKVRGSPKGGHIHLGGPDDAERFIMGEGIETVYSAREADLARAEAVEATLYWSSITLGNMGGRAREMVTHPTATITDIRGRVRKERVQGPVPDVDAGAPVLLLPPQVRLAYLLGDGDSDHFATRQTLLRAAARFRFDDAEMTSPARVDRRIMIPWADEGHDFNSMLRGAAA